jgi:DNA-binding CsgD family transcriptional regulator
LPEEKILSEREDQILQLVATGMTNREIAQSLTISPNTVKVHLSNIFEKLGVASRTEATLYGIEHGLVAVPGNEKDEQTQVSEAQPGLRKYLWVGVPLAVVLLGAILLALFGMDLIFPQPTPTPVNAQMAAELENRWQELAPMPEARSGLAATAYDGNIYAIAGEGTAGVSGSVFRYLTEEDRWEQRRDKPTPVRDVDAVLIGEKIYVPGGRQADERPTDILEIYDPRTDNWESGAPLPQAISAYALADFEGQMYLFGGWDGEKALDVVYIYDPGMDEWREGTPMPTARYHAGAVALADKIVVMGGKNERDLLDDVHLYYPARDRNGENPWEEDIDMPTARYDFGIASIYESVYVIGGFVVIDDNSNIGLLLADGSWTDLPTNQSYDGKTTNLISLDSHVVIIQPSITTNQTWMTVYQAFYYSIYIPIIQ